MPSCPKYQSDPGSGGSSANGSVRGWDLALVTASSERQWLRRVSRSEAMGEAFGVAGALAVMDDGVRR
jgi:hypothetical protein